MPNGPVALVAQSSCRPRPDGHSEFAQGVRDPRKNREIGAALARDVEVEPLQGSRGRVLLHPPSVTGTSPR
jgi:hypothetical protein